VQLHIGIDDTDSTKGGCTTYIAARLVEKLSKTGTHFIDYPNIIRLNPNIPYKTRGNAAVALRLETQSSDYDRIRETVLQEIELNSHFGHPGTDPAAVFVRGRPTIALKQFSRRALWDVLTERQAMESLELARAEAVAYGTRIGLIGALAAVGQTMKDDHTYELVAYRCRKYWGKHRRVDENTVKSMDALTTPRTFNNYDFENKRVLITPHGPDPVLMGLRGETPQTVKKAFEMLKIMEPVERWVIFRTNHGTENHLIQAPTHKTIRPNSPITLHGIVSSQPRIIRGGHVFLSLDYGRGTIQCAAFEPTGRFCDTVAKLIPGDEVTVYGGAKQREGHSQLTVNLEKIQINRLAAEFRNENPTCGRCGKHLKSAGKGQGFKCKECHKKEPEAAKRNFRKQRALRIGIYVPNPKAQRHLTKPMSRYGHEKRTWSGRPPSGSWHNP
jgi:tRNA(Ile2)-agmatinylcytidine synthase